MNSECHRENEVIQAIVKNGWTNELRVHVDSCASCRLAEQLLKSFQNIKTETEKQADVPPFHQVLIRSELQKKELNVRQFNRQISTGTLVSMVGACILITVLFLSNNYNWAAIQRSFSIFNFETFVLLFLLIALSELHLLSASRNVL